MSTEPFLNSITIYPVKSLDGISLQRAMITEGGCLLHDREYAITDQEGNFIIGKTNSQVYSLRSKVDFENEIISFRKHNEILWNNFHLEDEKLEIQLYLGAYFNVPVNFIKNSRGRFMDIPDVSGVTVVSTASLQAVSGWYSNMNLNETRKRFRATIEIGAVISFWEDHLFSTEGSGIEFKIGNVTIFGISPRARCIVPTRNPENGEITHAFPKIFARNRSATLPEWSTLSNYGHHYHLTVYCYIPSSEIGKFIEIGDKVTIVGEREFYQH